MVNLILNENISCAICAHLCSSTAIELVFWQNYEATIT